MPVPLARALLHQAGGVRLARWLHRKSVRILMYHRFSNREGLERQCRHIREHYGPVSMAQLGEAWETGRPLPPNSMAVTVDDGYRDFFRIAYPIFSAARIPVTVFLVSDFMDGKEWLWLDRVKFLFANTALPRHESFSLDSTGHRLDAARAVCEQLKRLPNEERVSTISRLQQALGVEFPADIPPEYEPLRWEEARRMADDNVTFGAHTVTHPILSRLPSSREMEQEIAGSKRRIEEALRRPCLHFCYPNGSAADFDTDCIEIVRRAGFQTAVTAIPGLSLPSTDRFMLRRIGVDPTYDQSYFERCLAGIRAN